MNSSIRSLFEFNLEIYRKIFVLFIVLVTVTTFLGASIYSDTFAQEKNQTRISVDPAFNNKTSFNITAASAYNEVLNPRQIEYPAHLGFNDLHIEAGNHINPNSTQGHNTDFLNVIVHHHYKVYDDLTAACLLFPTGMGDQDKLYGIEYVNPADLYNTLPEDEKKYWHYHLTELPKVHATTPDLTADEAAKVLPVLNETYGKVVYFWHLGDKLPIGEPKAVIIEDLIEESDEISEEDVSTVRLVPSSNGES